MKKRMNIDLKSIRVKVTFFVIALIIGQSLLLSGTMIAAGVLSEAEDDAIRSFSETVENRKNYLESEMRNRWTNIGPYVSELSGMIPETDGNGEMEAFLDESADVLIPMLRTTLATGVFLILDHQAVEEDHHAGMYIRDYEPVLNDEQNKDLYFLVGPFETAQRLGIPMERNWTYELELHEGNRAFFDRPYDAAIPGADPALFGYWSQPFSLKEGEQPVITYSMPFVDDQGRKRGVVGVEILTGYLTGFLPAADLQERNALGYLLGHRAPEDERLMPILTTGALQERMINTGEAFDWTVSSDAHQVYELMNHNSTRTIQASVRELGLYGANTPFEDEDWFLIGLMEDHELLAYVNRIQMILTASLIGSIVIGAVGGYLISTRFTSPIISLSEQVQEADAESFPILKRTGLTEIDGLLTVMENTNRDFVESTVKMAEIIDLVQVPIGAFEIKPDQTEVYATGQLKQLLQLNENGNEEILSDKQAFTDYLDQFMMNPEPEEEHTYKIDSDPKRWIRINVRKNEASTLGVVVDVTREMTDKRQIRKERDHDNLTGIYNRGAFERHVRQILDDQKGLATGAMIMLDLDYLKEINDTYGHRWGDVYIKETANALRLFIDEGGVVGRQSGDEFTVFLSGYENKDMIRERIERFYDSLKRKPIAFPRGEEREIRISSGVAWLFNEQVTYSYEGLIQSADRALYEAKDEERGTWFEE
ncbi:diguanylate cyclase domain-containing protein [Salisediminibacterium selenitireducens]|uniref:Diguanylate cyclase n=1 Tax=Bacillus selenitireducens (strain ATCC 700615 / DSM 15326 / MLS10) TaxID=439292 RepID=D6XZS9_BACIE|nr:diguanylate cyclase [Salisediminibacterium selenitireducens]ADI00431.1 diguanylate cyclase [[Bacillus] selenitireducens MLS10]